MEPRIQATRRFNKEPQVQGTVERGHISLYCTFPLYTTAVPPPLRHSTPP